MGIFSRTSGHTDRAPTSVRDMCCIVFGDCISRWPYWIFFHSGIVSLCGAVRWIFVIFSLLWLQVPVLVDFLHVHAV